MPTLLSIVDDLNHQDGDATIYAAEPWAPESQALVAIERESGIAPDGMSYLLEIAIARDVLEGWDPVGKRTTAERCQRIIEYALHDA